MWREERKQNDSIEHKKKKQMKKMSKRHGRIQTKKKKQLMINLHMKWIIIRILFYFKIANCVLISFIYEPFLLT